MLSDDEHLVEEEAVFIAKIHLPSLTTIDPTIDHVERRLSSFSRT